MVSGGARVLALVAVLGACGHAAPKEKGRMNAANDEKAWQTAETAARAHYKAKGWEVTEIERVPAMPYLLHVGFSDGVLDTLVLDGKIVDDKTGLDGLGAYLRGSKFLDRRSADADSMVRLLYYFQAFPSTAAEGGLYDLREKPALLPKLEWHDDGAALVINYVTSSASPAGMGGSKANANLMSVEQWTLKIPRNYALAWSRRMIEVPR